MNAREVALDALARIDDDGAYANLVVPRMLERASLARRDRGLVTELVYGVTRRRRALDHAIDGHLHDDVTPDVRRVLRLGAYQLLEMGVAPHAAVSTSVDLAPRRVKGLVNAVLRRVAVWEPHWPSDAVRLSYPDWIVERLIADLGAEDALAALEAMNRPVGPVARDDGYVQDAASQAVVEAVAAEPGERVLDACAAPGGKATGAASGGAKVVAADRRLSRARLVASNAASLDASEVSVVVADGRRCPHRPGSFDRVLVDAPCSGLGALGRRPDARWRIDEAGVERLVDLQVELLGEAATMVRRGGVLVYSVCTMSVAETTEVASTLGDELEPLALGEPWRRWGSGGQLLPQDLPSDGMSVFRWRQRDAPPGGDVRYRAHVAQ